MEELGTKVVLEADASKFKEGVAGAAKEVQELSDDVKNELQSMRDEFQRLQKELNLSTAKFGIDDSQTKNVQASIESLKQTWDNFTSDIQGVGVSIPNLDGSLQPEKSISSLEAVRQKINEIKAEVSDIKGEWKDAFKGGNGEIKKVALALVGVRTIFSAIRKAMSTYLSQNDELKAKLDGIWYALGSMFAPVLEFLINLFAKLIAYINAFVQGLGFAGINMKGLAKGAGATAKAMKQLAGFDEINNLSTDNGGGGAGGAGIANPLDFANVNTGAIELIKRYADEIAAVLLAIAAALLLVKLRTAGIVDLTNKQIAGIALIVAGVALAIKNLIDYLKDPSWQNFGQFLEGIGLAIVGIGLVVGSTATVIAGVVVLIVGYLASIHDEVMAFFDKIQNALNNALEWVHTNITTHFGVFGALVGSFIEGIIILLQGAVEIVKQIFDGTVTGLKQILDGFILFFKGDFKGGLQLIWEGIKTIFNSALNAIKTAITTIWNTIKTVTTNVFNSLPTPIKNAFTAIWNFIKPILNNIIAGFEKMVNGAITGINKLTGGLRSLGNKVTSFIGLGTVFNELSTISLPRLATGTNYVPQDMIAMLHQGEAVVPERYNPYANGSNPQSDDILDAILNVADILQSKEFNAYISSREIGQTAVNFIKSQSRVLGGSII